MISDASRMMARGTHHWQGRPADQATSQGTREQPSRLSYRDPEFFEGTVAQPRRKVVELTVVAPAMAQPVQPAAPVQNAPTVVSLPTGPSGGPMRSPRGERAGNRQRVKQGLRGWRTVGGQR